MTVWKTIKQSGLGAGAKVRAKTASGNVVDAVLKGPAHTGQRWFATNLETNKEVQVTKVLVTTTETRD